MTDQGVAIVYDSFCDYCGLTASTGDHMAVVHRRITLLDDGSPLIEYVEDRK